MKYPSPLILIVIVLFCSAMVNAQNDPPTPPEARKIEEFKFSTQGHVKMLLDSFFNELNNNPSDQGHVIVYPKTERQRAIIEKIVRTHIKWRKFDATRVTIVKGPINSGGFVQFWLVPPGADAPNPLFEMPMELPTPPAPLKSPKPVDPFESIRNPVKKSP